MSRGLGTVQRLVLAAVERETSERGGWLSIGDAALELAQNRRGGDALPTSSEFELVRRAARTLEARGLLQCGWMPRERWAGGRWLRSRKELRVSVALVSCETLKQPDRRAAEQRYAELQRLLQDGAAGSQEGDAA